MRLEATSLKLFSYDSMIDGTERKTDSRIFQNVLRNISLAIEKKKMIYFFSKMLGNYMHYFTFNIPIFLFSF
jgi:hypothetical protein